MAESRDYFESGASYTVDCPDCKRRMHDIAAYSSYPIWNCIQCGKTMAEAGKLY